MKLFVFGEVSPFPEEWSKYSHRWLLLAENIEEAARMTDGIGSVLEVDMDRASYPSDFLALLSTAGRFRRLVVWINGTNCSMAL
jgi:hypothetical protein